MNSEASLSMEVDTLYAWFELHISASYSMRFVFEPYVEKSLDVDSTHFQLLAAMSNVISVSSSSSFDRSSNFLLQAMVNLLVAAIVASTGAPTNLTAVQSALFFRARALIEERFSDETFTVAELAASLSISKNYLHRIFGMTGVSARQSIEARRVLAATLYLGSASTAEHLFLKEVAAKSGFTSVRQMHAAIDRQKGAQKR